MGKNEFNQSDTQKYYKNYRRSIYTKKLINKGDKFTLENISIVRPGYGAHPKYFKKILNKKSPHVIKKLKIKFN